MRRRRVNADLRRGRPEFPARREAVAMDTGTMLATLGMLLLCGLALEWLGRNILVPRVTMLIVFGFLVGPESLDLLPGRVDAWFEPVTRVALVMIGFLLGERLSRRRLRGHGRSVLGLSAVAAAGTSAVTGAGLLALGVDLPLALLLAAIAAATAPAATYDVVEEARADGPFTDTLLGIVGIDDAWGLLLFSLALALAVGLGSDAGASGAGVLLAAGREIGGALGLGVALGLPAALLTHRIAAGEPTLVEALGIVFLTAGLATVLEVSFILAAMVLGAVMVNVGRERARAFHEIEHLEWPFMVLFFILAGAAMQPAVLLTVGWLGAAYIALRIAGKLASAAVGGWLLADTPVVRRWLGIALLPQAGVALGMALVARERFPATGDLLLSLVIAATVVFEIFGPFCTRLALKRSGECGRAPGEP